VAVVVLTSNNQGPTKTSETLGTGSRVTANQAKGTAPLNQPWESQYVYNPKPDGTSTPRSSEELGTSSNSWRGNV
jgi:hypothetical protein